MEILSCAMGLLEKRMKTGCIDMPSLTNKRQVKAFALANSPKGKTRVSQAFLDGIETATRLAILKQLNHHDNKISKGKTLV